MFDPSTLAVTAGSKATAVLSLLGVPAAGGAEVTVALSAADAATAGVMPESVVFDAATTSRDVTVVGVAEGIATVTAELESFSGLSEESTVASAELSVTVVPAPVRLQLAFDPPTLTVVVGATATAVLSLLDVPEGAAVTVALRTADVAAVRLVTEPELQFSATTTSRDVTVLGVAEGSTTVTVVADASGTVDLPPDSSVASAELAVTVVPPPVHLQLAFEPTDLTVTAGAASTAVLSLLDVPEGAAVTVALRTADAATVQVMPESVVFDAATTSRDVTALGVAAGSATLTAMVAVEVLLDDLPPDSTVASAELAVTVVPAPVRLQLAFEPPELTVVVGATATAVLSLSDVPEGAAVTVALRTEDAATARLVTEPELQFSATTTSRDVTVLGVAEGSTTLTVVADASGTVDLPPDSSVASAELAVTVVPPPVRLQLAFEPTDLTVTAGAASTAVLSLLDVPEGAAVTVALRTADAATVQVMPESVVFDAATTSRDVTVLGVAAASATLTAMTAVMAVEVLLDDLPPDSTVASAELSVTVVPAPVRLQLAFEPPELTVVVGATATAVLSLLDVPEGAAVTVALRTADVATAQVMPESVVFDAATTSRDVTVLGVAEGSTTLTVVADASGTVDLPPDSSVASAELAVTVVPPPVHLQLAFDPSALTVTAGATKTAVLSLLDVPAGAAVTVALIAADGEATAQVMSQSVVFDAATTSRDVTVEGVAAGNTTLTASVDENALADSGFPPDSTVASAELAVTVVLLPVALQLVFDLSTLTVTAGSEETVMLSLLGVPAGAAVTVEFSAANASTARVVMQPVVFDAATTSREVTVLGVAAGSATLTAIADISGLPDGSSVTDANLLVTVVPAPVALRLAFIPPTAVTITVGTRSRPQLMLFGELPAGAAVTVSLSATDATIAQVIPESVTLSGDTRNHVVTVTGMAEGSATVTAVADFFVTSDLPAGSTVASAELLVTVVPPPVHLQLAFDPPELTVAAGATKTAVLSLSGELPAGATVQVDLSVADTATALVMPSSVTFTTQTPSHVVTILGVAEGSTTVTVVADASGTVGLPPDSTVAPAQLSVTVVEPPLVALQLAFEPTTLTVAAGTTETAVLSLSGVPVVATVTVKVSAASTATAQVRPELVVFDAATTSREVTVLGVAEGSATVTAELVSFRGLSAGSSVASVELAVTVVPPPVRLQLAFEPSALTVTAGATETAVLSLLDVPEGAAVTVALRTASTATVQVMPESVVFDAATTSRAVTLIGVAAASTTLTAMTMVMAVEVSLDDLPPDSTVAPAQLSVTVVPAPIHLQLAFEPPELTVVVGAQRTVVLRLLDDVPAGVTVFLTLQELRFRGWQSWLGRVSSGFLSCLRRMGQ